MNDLHKRWILFLLGCIPSRFLLSYIMTRVSQTQLRYIGFILLLPVIGWIYIYITKSRKTGAETFGKPIWWNNFRPIHAIFYFIGAILAISQSKYAYVPILLDTFFGLGLFICYHFDIFPK